jgi:hypothetical protein
MNGRDHYLANDVECQSMASVTRDASEPGTWLEMAESWLRLAEAIKNRRNRTRSKQGSLAKAQRLGSARRGEDGAD